MINGSLSPTGVIFFGILILQPGILFLILPGTLFALVFDRTDMLLGIHLDGWASGISLSAKIIVEVVLLIFIVRSPASFDWFVKISLVFSGFLLVNSIITAKTALQGYPFFSQFSGVIFVSGIGLASLQMLKPYDGDSR